MFLYVMAFSFSARIYCAKMIKNKPKAHVLFDILISSKYPWRFKQYIHVSLRKIKCHESATVVKRPCHLT